jgi:acyl-CoA thioesterase FadM
MSARQYRKYAEWITVLFLAAASLALPFYAYTQDIQTGSVSAAPRIGPGERLPVRVKLSNFGSTARTDVIVNYAVISSGGIEVLVESETVAVETTATYIHDIALPDDISPGTYTTKTSVIYPGQKAPAVGSYEFKVERKFFGVFMSDLIIYSSIALGGLGVSFLVLWLVRRNRAASLAPHDYSSLPSDIRIYYEIVEDVIRQMRFHEGDKALAMTSKVSSLAVNATTGKVMRITGDPAAAVAALVSEYEKNFGRRVNISFSHKRENRATVR